MTHKSLTCLSILKIYILLLVGNHLGSHDEYLIRGTLQIAINIVNGFLDTQNLGTDIRNLVLCHLVPEILAPKLTERHSGYLISQALDVMTDMDSFTPPPPSQNHHNYDSLIYKIYRF